MSSLYIILGLVGAALLLPWVITFFVKYGDWVARKMRMW